METADVRKLKDATPQSLVPLTEFEDHVVGHGCSSVAFNVKSAMQALCKRTKDKVVWTMLVWGKGMSQDMHLCCAFFARGNYLLTNFEHGV